MKDYSVAGIRPIKLTIQLAWDYTTFKKLFVSIVKQPIRSNLF